MGKAINPDLKAIIEHLEMAIAHHKCAIEKLQSVIQHLSPIADPLTTCETRHPTARVLARFQRTIDKNVANRKKGIQL